MTLKVTYPVFKSKFDRSRYHAALKVEIDNYKPIPVITQLDNSMIQRNYLQVRQDVGDLVKIELERMMEEVSLKALIVRK